MGRNHKSGLAGIEKSIHGDEYQSLPATVEFIVPYLRKRKFKTIWCPFDKAYSSFVTVLNLLGFKVVNTHIHSGQDFFKMEVPEGIDAIVSNPPFSKKTELFARLYEIGKPFAMVMNFIGLFDNHRRWELFKKNGYELLIPDKRIKFKDKNGKILQPNFMSVYVCHGILDEQNILAPYPWLGETLFGVDFGESESKICWWEAKDGKPTRELTEEEFRSLPKHDPCLKGLWINESLLLETKKIRQALENKK